MLTPCMVEFACMCHSILMLLLSVLFYIVCKLILPLYVYPSVYLCLLGVHESGFMDGTGPNARLSAPTAVTCDDRYFLCALAIY